MGLAAAYQAVRDGHDVGLLEAASQAGVMAAHFDFGGVSLESFTTLSVAMIARPSNSSPSSA
jgi:phytoene dehydrogenase-like protein